MLDTVIKGGTVMTPAGVGKWDVGIMGEKVVVVAAPGSVPMEAKRIVNAEGRIVAPGGIEPHIHAASNLQPNIPQIVPDMPNAGPLDHTLGAIWGGTTTVVDFAPAPNEGDLVKGVHDFMKVWKGQGYTDYSTHCVYTDKSTPDAISRYGELVRAGFPSVKIFTTDTRPEGHRPSYSVVAKIDMGRLDALMRVMQREDGMLAVHGADDELTMYNYLIAKEMGWWDWPHISKVHSNLVEEMAFQRVVRLAKKTGVGMYFVHVTAREGLEAIEEARSEGMAVYGEVLTLALSFNADNYKTSDGMKFHTYPSLKYEEDKQRLWKGLLHGELTVTATDSGFTTYTDKIAGRNVLDMRGGNIGIEIRMGVVYSEAVVKRGMSLERYADITSTNAAKMLGFYPRKGVIAIGSDADICIIDPNIKKKLSMKDLHVRDYSPWEGWDVQGWPSTVLLRGKMMVDGGKLLGKPGDGQLIPRKMTPAYLQRPAF
jgi:dihydropyrimidinase